MLLAACALSAVAMAQTDPVIMTVNGQPVLRSEFEYSYNKNNSEGVIDKKTVDEYVDLFINYKLKVIAALDEKYDTLKSFKKEFAQYRDQQLRPMLVTDADVEAEAHRIYDETVKRIGPDGLVQASHILLRLNQQAPDSEVAAAKVRIDSIYKALKAGADFAELAKKVSEDPGSARQGGLLPFVQRGQFVKEFEVWHSLFSQDRCRMLCRRLTASISSRLWRRRCSSRLSSITITSYVSLNSVICATV